MTASSLPLLASLFAFGSPATAQEDNSAARALQDPLAYISALMTDNTITLNQGPNKDQTGYNFQLQPVYSIQTDNGYSLVPRAVFPIIGAPVGTSNSTEWGLSDSVVQMFVAPSTNASVKWGFGPQVSLRTRSSDKFAGPGWGGGLAGVVVWGDGPWSTAGIVNHLWGEDGFSSTQINPVVYYNWPSGWFVSYNNTLVYDWAQPSGQNWTVPVGLSAGKAIGLEGGYGLELLLGAYRLVERPDGAGDTQIKFGISAVFPR